MFRKIAIVGKMHAGKTTLANMLVERSYTRMAFADPVKEIAAEMLNKFLYCMNDDRAFGLDSINAEKGHPAIRGLLQLVGTELGRQWYGPDTIWIDMFKDRIEALDELDRSFDLPPEVRIVNDDCRFVNESVALKELGFTIVKLRRPEDERVASIIAALKKQNKDASPQEISRQLEKILGHGSETEVDNIAYDYEFNSTTMRSLERLATLLASGEKPSILRDVEYSDVVRDVPHTARDIPIGMRAHYAH